MVAPRKGKGEGRGGGRVVGLLLPFLPLLCFFPHVFWQKFVQSEGDFSVQQTGGLELRLASSSSPSQFQDYKMMVPGDSYGT